MEVFYGGFLMRVNLSLLEPPQGVATSLRILCLPPALPWEGTESYQGGDAWQAAAPVHLLAL